MYDKMFTDMQETMKPAVEMMEVNGRTMEQLVKQQTALMNELFQTGVEHSKAVAETKDFNALAELQKSYFAEVSQKMMDVSKQNLDLLVDAKDAVTKIVEASFKGIQAQAAPAKAAAPAKKAAPKAAPKTDAKTDDKAAA